MAAINDPSNGNAASVLDDGRLEVDAKSSPLQHIVSSEQQQAYQAQGSTTIAAGTETILHIKNTSTTGNMVITFLRLQIIGVVAAVPEAATYVTLNQNTTIASGGVELTPINMYLGHSNAATVVSTSGETPIVTAGTPVEFDRWYPSSDGDARTYNKEGVLIVPPQQSINIAVTSGTIGGDVHCRVSFIMEDH